MNRARRWATALLLCGLVVGLSPSLDAAAEPTSEAGVGTVLADLGTAVQYADPGFSPDGAYYAYLAPSGDRCDLRVYVVAARKPVGLTHAHVVCDHTPISWASDAATLVWQVNAAAGMVTEYAWDADSGVVSVLAGDAQVLAPSSGYLKPAVSADGRFLAFIGRSDTHPAPGVDPPRNAWYVWDRTTGVSLPLSSAAQHVEFLEWGPTGHHFLAGTGGRTPFERRTGVCFGSGTACDVVEPDVFFGYGWSRDGSAVVGEVVPGGVANTVEVHDFTDGSSSSFPTRAGYVDYASFVGPGSDRVLGSLRQGVALWDRTKGTVVRVSDGLAEPSPTGQYLLASDARPEAYLYRDLTTGTSAPATFRGTRGHWTRDGSSFLGVGPGGCSSLRQWSPTTNTVSLFGPPTRGACYAVASGPGSESGSSASGRFTVVNQPPQGGPGAGPAYLVDLRRHVLLGPLKGYPFSFAPAGRDVLAVAQPLHDDAYRVLLVDPTPAPDVDDKPRWSATKPATGARVEAAVGGRTTVQLGASDLQGTPVNLYFRWRDTAGTPIASAPKGWSCDRRRLAAGATVADCTFAPPKDFTATRFLDVSATNSATGAQSDTRSYRVAVG